MILKQDKAPSEVIRDKEDKGVCNDCKFGSAFSGACYVNTVTQGPNGIWRAYKRGAYPHIAMENFLPKLVGESLRCGSYGDPVAVPVTVWEPMIDVIRKSKGMWTSYTHSWRIADDRFREFTVASVDSLDELSEARVKGWRTFRTLLPNEDLAANEFDCPAQEGIENKVTCEKCGACNGNNGRATRGSAAILAHGSKGKIKRYDLLRQSIRSES